MDKRMKLALLALLGFSTACSTVKSGSKSKDGQEAQIEQPTTIVMYGVRPPVQDEKAVEIQEKKLTAPETPAVSITSEEVRPEGTK